MDLNLFRNLAIAVSIALVVGCLVYWLADFVGFNPWSTSLIAICTVLAVASVVYFIKMQRATSGVLWIVLATVIVTSVMNDGSFQHGVDHADDDGFDDEDAD